MVSFLRRPSPRERHLFLFTIGDHHFIDELSTVVGIDAEDRKREQRVCALEGRQHRLSTTIQEGEAFGPAHRDVGEGQGVQIASLGLYAAVGDQVCL